MNVIGYANVVIASLLQQILALTIDMPTQCHSFPVVYVYLITSK